MLALELTHSPAQAGFIAGLGAVPFLALTLASIPVALLLGHLTVLQLYVAALAEGALATIFNIAGMASLPRIVGKQQLTQATSVDYILRHTVMMVGPSPSGALFGAMHGLPFLADAISSVVSVRSLRWMAARFQDERRVAPHHLGREIVR